jgi:hypothetical protein
MYAITAPRTRRGPPGRAILLLGAGSTVVSVVELTGVQLLRRNSELLFEAGHDPVLAEELVGVL